MLLIDCLMSAYLFYLGFCHRTPGVRILRLESSETYSPGSISLKKNDVIKHIKGY